MFCKNCGKEINDNAAICIHCGVAVAKEKSDEGESKTGIGVLMGLFLGLIGLIIGLCMYKAETVERKTFMKGWGITFGICAVLTVILFAVYGSVIFAILGEYGYLYSMVI